MSVTGGGIRRFNDYEQLEHQNYTVSARLENPNTNIGAQGQIEVERIADGIDVAGGLERGELAELVAIGVFSSLVTDDQPHEVSSDFNVRHELEVSRLESSKTLNTSDTEQQFEPQSTGGNNVGDEAQGSLTTRLRETTKPGVLYHAMNYIAGRGTQGAHNFMQPGTGFVIPFREVYGAGPVFDEDDDIFNHVSWNITDYATDNNLSAQHHIMMSWDVEQQEQA